MKFLFFILLSFTGISLFAQDNWTVGLDAKTLLSASAENAEKNVVRVSESELKNYKCLVVNYKEKEVKKDWERTIAIYDEKDSEVLKQTGSRLTIKANELAKLLQSSNTLKIYTTAVPNDPALRERIRIRRVHLCTLVLQ